MTELSPLILSVAVFPHTSTPTRSRILILHFPFHFHQPEYQAVVSAVIPTPRFRYVFLPPSFAHRKVRIDVAIISRCPWFGRRKALGTGALSFLDLLTMTTTRAGANSLILIHYNADRLPSTDPLRKPTRSHHIDVPPGCETSV